LQHGPANLSDRELVAILLGTGIRGKNVWELSEEVLAFLDSREGPVEIPDLNRIAGLGTAKSSLFVAALELSRRLLCPGQNRIRFPADVLPFIRHYADRKQELFLGISLNGAHEILAVRIVSVGLVNRTIVHPREVFADPLTDRAAAVVVAHNHPSGNVEPSPEDREVTRRLVAAGETLGMHVLDHIIFSRERYYSFLENGDLG
jgi:DNA repair protein RadC